MGFLWRQGRIRMEVVIMGLLILIGTMLERSEGLECYVYGTDPGDTELCYPNEACYKHVGDSGGIHRGCMTSYNKRCKGCTKLSTQADNDDFIRCHAGYGRTSIENENTARVSLRALFNDKARQDDYLTGTICVCYTHLCNHAGRSTPSAQVILGVLMAASMSAFNIALGSL